MNNEEKKLEIEFNDTVRQQIEIKLREAAESLNEAVNIAKASGLPGIVYNDYTWDDVYYKAKRNSNFDEKEFREKMKNISNEIFKINKGPLTKALDNAGWNTSSMSC